MKERTESINLMEPSQDLSTLEEGAAPRSDKKKTKKKSKKKHHHHHNHNRHAIERFGQDNGSSNGSHRNSNSVSNSKAGSSQQHQQKAAMKLSSYMQEEKDFEVATWQQMSRECCFHSSREWGMIAVQVVAVAACLYFFLVGIELLGEAAKVMFGCKAGTLFDDDSNPLSALMIGILATVLMQSSSTSTAVVVSMVEGQVLTVNQGIYMVMGANVGTTITSTIVSFGQFHAPVAAANNKTQRFRRHEFERAFACATLHDVFNMCTVALLFPLECATGYLSVLTSVLVEGAETGHREDHYVGPVKRIVSPLTRLLIISNKKVVNGVAAGKSCQAFYPIECDTAEGGRPTYDTCPSTGLIACDKNTNKCPLFFRSDATITQDQVAGVVCFVLGLAVLFISMICFTHVIQKMLHGMSKNVVHTATNCNGYIGILCGIGITMIVQSSSIVTSVLVPLVGTEALRLQTSFPIIVGANIGTAVGALVSAMDSIGTGPLQVALAHLFFNLTGALIWYPLPRLRNIIMFCNRRLAHGVDIWRWFAFIYLIGMFFLVPIFFLGLSNLYTKGNTASLVVAILLTIAFGGGLLWLTYWCKVQGGDVKYVRFIKALKKRASRRQNQRKAARGTDNNTDNVTFMDNGEQEAQNGKLSRSFATHPTVESLATLPDPSIEERQQLHLQQLQQQENRAHGASRCDSPTKEPPAWLSVTKLHDRNGSEVCRLSL